MKRIAVYPGAFDPVTLGHLSLINRSMKLVDKLVIAVAQDTSKNSTFTVKERCAMIEHDLIDHVQHCKKNQEIQVIGFSGLLVDFVKKQEANLIIRGLRTVSDLEYEFQLFSVNSKLAPDVETLFIPATDDVCYISSTIVREISKLRGDVSKFVSNRTARILKQHFNGKLSVSTT